MRSSVVPRLRARVSRVQDPGAEEEHGEEQHDPPPSRHLA
jgi:hypothetical protein